MSHTTKAAGGTTFIHNGGYDGDVRIVTSMPAKAVADPEWGTRWETTIPFTDLRELVFAYLRERVINAAESANDTTFEKMLLGDMREPDGNA